MDEADNADDPVTAADNPLEMRSAEAAEVIGRVLHLRRRILAQHRRLAEGADPLDVDIAVEAELAKFAQQDRVLRTLGLPSGAFMRALADMQDGGDPDYFRRGKRQRPALTSQRHFIGNTAHLVETLVAGKKEEAFTVTAAVERVASALLAAGFQPPKKGSDFKRAVEDWHAAVVHKARKADPARDLFEKQQAALKLAHPDHKQWDEERRKKWLSDSVRDMVRNGYFGATKPG